MCWVKLGREMSQPFWVLAAKNRQMSATIGVVVPAYRPTVPVLTSHVEALRSTIDPAAILVVLDDPKDGVPERVRESGARVDVSQQRRGKGQAIAAGFDALGTDRLAFSDADASTPAGSLADVIDALDHADVAIGSRRHPEASVEVHQSQVRRRLGDVFARVARRVLAVDAYDFQCGAKAVTAPAWDRVGDHLRETGFGWDVELVAVADALGCRIVEVPVRWRDQPGSSVPPVRTAVDLGRALVSTRVRTANLRSEAEDMESADQSSQVRSDGAGE